jgi:DNA (cytosine-5)-methyltransferase 1
MSLTFTDIFCGAGGSSIGLTAAGLELTLAANHWQRAIETHAANFRDAEHLCADVNNYDMRRLPKTDVLWASPICTEISPAGGRKRRHTQGQLDLLEQGPVAQAGFERTRATFHDVIRATEVHRYSAVLVENVADVADGWELFDWWVTGMKTLGYHVQFVSVSSAHIGDDSNDPPRNGVTGSTWFIWTVGH